MLDELELNMVIRQGEEKLFEVKKYLFFKDKKERIKELEKKTLELNFWDDRKEAEKRFLLEDENGKLLKKFFEY